MYVKRAFNVCTDMTFNIIFLRIFSEIYLPSGFIEQSNKQKGMKLFFLLVYARTNGKALLFFSLRIFCVRHLHKCDHGRKPSLPILGYCLNKVCPIA